MSNLAIFSPLLRQSVGFDRFNDLFESLADDKKSERFEAYPPYNIIKLSDDSYRIDLAIAGFRTEELNITAQDDRLIVTGQHIEEQENTHHQYLHKGIAKRAFERSFRLADHIRVEDAVMDHGMLSITLVREVPEEKKPRSIPINFSKEKK